MGSEEKDTRTVLHTMSRSSALPASTNYEMKYACFLHAYGSTVPLALTSLTMLQTLL
jgi:hypothetical protein